MMMPFLVPPSPRRPAPRLSARSRRYARAGVALLCAGLATACLRTRRDPVTGRVAVDVRSPLQKGTVWDAKLNGKGTATTSTAPSGTARADVLDGRTTLAIRVTGLTAGETHPWRVHEGGCDQLGAQFADAQAYPPLLVNNQGVAEGTAQLPALDIARKYKVRLFVSPTDSTSEAACGNLIYR
jgi:hypothetical protein